MTPERWEQIREILEKALELSPGERSAFLEQACSSNPSLRREVETLLTSSDDARSSFLESTPLRVTLAAGTMLGEYEVKSLLGSGGMGEVYRARDSRLGRDVAIKILPSIVSSDRNRLRRFEQEARAAAALNHPNILAVYQLGTYEGAPYLVSELLEGETLREQIKRGRIAVRKVIDHGTQIARGLAAAHEKGIVHRDLKPENLFVTKDGRLKILDFGLAKLTQPQTDSGHGLPEEGTEPGVIMGTVGYMSPEQVRGQTTDHRTDIFAFGAILYELLAGKRAFQKPTSPETLTAILNEDPPGISEIAANTPPSLQRVVHRCLEKNQEQRFQSASDLAFALDALSDELRYQQHDSESGSRSAANSGTVTVAKVPARQIRVWKIVASVLLAAVLVAGGMYYRWRQQRRERLTEADTIVLTDFANSTGDAIFDDTLKTALGVSLRQSPFLNVVSDGKAGRILRQMAVPAGAKLTPELAQKLCQRAGSKAYIAGAIGSLGNEYVLALKATSCQDGNTLAQEQMTAASKENVVNALGVAASKLRAQLGESLATVQRFDVPLADATTSSLEALQAYALGRNASSAKGVAATLIHDQRAIELDPNFAMGYTAVGADYSNLGELERANEYITKAFQLREHASEREKLAITARYYSDVTGELEKGAQTFQQEIQGYPREDAPYVNLGIVYAELGQYDKALEITRPSLRLAPDSVGTKEDLTNYTIALGRFDEARQILHEMEERKMDDVAMHNALYALAFLAADTAAMAEQQHWFAGQPQFENWGLALTSDTEAYAGHAIRARELTKQAADSAVKADSKESAAVFQAIGAQRDAVYGNAAKARQEAAEALKLAPTSQGAESEAALAFALAGDTAQAESLAQDLAKRFPLNTQMQSAWLPAIQTQLALDRKTPALALNAGQVDSPVALGQIGFVLNMSCMYSVYVRGEAYLAAGQGSASAAEFQKVLDHSGVVWNCWTGALAHLGVARANALQSRTSQGADADAARVRALAAYRDFLTLWKDADPDLPVLKQAKAEFAKLLAAR
jgi:serine/threonine protein kinase/tetratricopeptide (TPR) repeat protein